MQCPGEEEEIVKFLYENKLKKVCHILHVTYVFLFFCFDGSKVYTGEGCQLFKKDMFKLFQFDINSFNVTYFNYFIMKHCKLFQYESL